MPVFWLYDGTAMKTRSKSGIDIEFETQGAGDPLLLIMGISAQLVMWPDEFCTRLVDRGFHVIRMDNRDVGLSTHLHHAGVPDVRASIMRTALGLRVAAPYRLEDMAGDSVAVLDHLGIDRAHIVGASMGGMIAQTLALEHTARVASLTSIMSTPGDRLFALGASPFAVRALMGPQPRTREESATRTFEVFSAIGSRTHRPDEALLRNMGERSFDRGANAAGFARHLAAICASGSRTEGLRKLRVPTLVIHGTQDPLIPVAAGRATARHVRNARMLELADMGHDLPRPLWDTIADAIRSVARDAETVRQA